MSMTPKEAISYIENYGWSTTRLGLERTKELLEKLGNPQKSLKFIHVAGSNGKGSTCAMIAAILESAGYKTGLYISPYIEIFNERIQINGEYISGERLAEITERVMAIADAMEDHPSQFELVTAIAIQYYYEEKCDIVVLEVGMGGALDSTNAIDAPEVAVITNIGLEHTEYLGSNLEEIAETKSGIIKPGCNCVCYDGDQVVVETVQKVCEKIRVPLTIAYKNRIRKISSGLNGQEFMYLPFDGSDKGEEYNLALLGDHQLRNVAVVLAIVQVLRDRGWKINRDAVRTGLRKVKWPARFEVLNRNPLFILDGGHNPQCAEALVESIKEYLPEEKIIFLLGVLGDKDYESIIQMMMPFAEEFICVTPLSERALPAFQLAEYIRSLGGNATYADDIPQGVMKALEKGENNPIIGFGSLYLAGAVRKEFKKREKAALRSRGIKNRNALTEEERIKGSEVIANRILSLPEYEKAEKVFLYKWTKGEVRLDALESFNNTESHRKRFLYPLTLEDGEMVALEPGEGRDSWKTGAFGILEPVYEKGKEVSPEEIDFVICPLSAFDREGNRLGMGGGYYDRFLPKCKNAVIVGVAFDVQEIYKVPREPYDYKPDMIITDSGIVKGHQE